LMCFFGFIAISVFSSFLVSSVEKKKKSIVEKKKI
jgi:hypothetical protein